MWNGQIIFQIEFYKCTSTFFLQRSLFDIKFHSKVIQPKVVIFEMALLPHEPLWPPDPDVYRKWNSQFTTAQPDHETTCVATHPPAPSSSAGEDTVNQCSNAARDYHYKCLGRSHKKAPWHWTVMQSSLKFNFWIFLPFKLSEDPSVKSAVLTADPAHCSDAWMVNG